VGILKSLLGVARAALGAITGAAGATVSGLGELYAYITNEHNLLAWLTGGPELELEKRYLVALADHTGALEDIRAALARVGAWIYANLVKPAVDRLNKRISALAAYVRQQISMLYVFINLLYQQSLAYTRAQVGAERAARVTAVKTEHAQMLQRVTAAIQSLNNAAASGYNTGATTRLETIAGLLDTIADDNPLTKDLVSLLANGILDLAEVDDPLLRFGLGKLLQDVIARAGVDAAVGDLVSSLLGTAAAQPQAHSLYDVEKDVAGRLNALEQWIASFMAGGGADLEQAGREWKDLRSITVDAAVLGFFALAVADPQAWADGVADTAGVVIDGALTGIVEVISAV
jgi:hypothetical protein